MQGTMQPYGNNFIPVILVEDDLLHTPEKPFCFVDPACPCHQDEQLVEEVVDFIMEGLMTSEEAIAFVAGRTV